MSLKKKQTNKQLHMVNKIIITHISCLCNILLYITLRHKRPVFII